MITSRYSVLHLSEKMYGFVCVWAFMFLCILKKDQAMLKC